MSDGLSLLQQQRAKATSARHLPPPRHAREQVPEAPAAPPEIAKDPVPTRTPTVDTRPATEPDSHTPAAGAVQVKAPTTSSMSQLVRATIYLEEADDEWLEDIAISGRRCRPRIDASRSAVTRLALERLRQEMSTEEILGLLAQRAAASAQAVGRKRL